MGGFSAFHWLIFLLVVIVLFGASRLPKIGEGLGQGIKSFKREMKTLNEDEEDEDEEDIKKKRAKAKLVKPKSKIASKAKKIVTVKKKQL